jgi:DNA-binding SARP family transcriptional activator
MCVKMLRLLTFGGLALEGGNGSPAPRLRPQRLAILAVLANAGAHGISRERISAIFWPDSDDPRHALRQALYALRQELGAEVIRNDGVLTLDREKLASDIADFRSALAAGERTQAASFATGPFLHGFSLPSCPEFERWAEQERAVISADATKLVLSLAKEAQTASDFEAAADWWRRLTILDPLSGRFALGYLKALASGGDRAGALSFARSHERLVRRELESDPDPDIRRLESELRAIPSPAVMRAPPSVPASIPSNGNGDAFADDVPYSYSRRDSGAALLVDKTHSPWRRVAVASIVLVGMIALAAAFSTVRWRSSNGISSDTPTFAVGMIREEGVPDTLRIGGVLTDMLATNLARVGGLSVLATSRLFELMLPGADTLITGYSDAARRAGATEILQGRLLSGPQWSLALEIQRVDLKTGLVKGGYRVAAADRYALVDSMTAAIASDLRLKSPQGSVADATTDNPIAYRLYEEGLRAFYQYDEAAALRLMNAALQEDSMFAMAAYYAARSRGYEIGSAALRTRAIRLAVRAPERERLAITAEFRAEDMDPSATAIAESLATKYPMDPRGHEYLWKAHFFRGDWAASVIAIERAIALDSASEPAGRQGCRLCNDFYDLSETYFWWDSLAAAERTAQRMLRLRPDWHNSWDMLAHSAAAKGDTAAAHLYARHFREASPIPVSPFYFVRRDMLVEDYDRADAVLQTYLDSPRPDEIGEAVWLESILLRNEGRINEGLKLAIDHRGPQDMNIAVTALEGGNARLALPELLARDKSDVSFMSPSLQARQHAWNNTLIGMALLVAGDTGAVRHLADTVEYWGRRSLYGRDQRAHHYLRGMLLVAQGRDNEAASELREAIHSTTNGFTRVNYELGKVLLRLNHPAEAVPIVRAALHGDIDGSSMYVTRTDLHEVLAQAFDRMGNRDSAAVHYRAVAKAWVRADSRYQARRAVASTWLASRAPSTIKVASNSTAKPRP